MKTPSALALPQDGFEQVYEYSQNHCILFDGNGRSRLVSAILCLTGMGLVYQSLATALDRRNYPPPGRLVDVSGCRLHLQSAGSGTPTVVLEAGLGGMSSVWAWIQPETAKFCHVVSYDRAGLGWSEADISPKTAMQAVLRLRTLLQSANISPLHPCWSLNGRALCSRLCRSLSKGGGRIGVGRCLSPGPASQKQRHRDPYAFRFQDAERRPLACGSWIYPSDRFFRFLGRGSAGKTGCGSCGIPFVLQSLEDYQR